MLDRSLSTLIDDEYTSGYRLGKDDYLQEVTVFDRSAFGERLIQDGEEPPKYEFVHGPSIAHRRKMRKAARAAAGTPWAARVAIAQMSPSHQSELLASLPAHEANALKYDLKLAKEICGL